MTNQLNEWRNDNWSFLLESPDLEDSHTGSWVDGWLELLLPQPPGHIGVTALLNSSRKTLDASVEAWCQPVNNQSEPSVIEMVDEATWAYTFASASEPDLTNPSVVQDAIRVLKFGKTPDPNSISNRPVKHLPQSCHVPPCQGTYHNSSNTVLPTTMEETNPLDLHPETR